MMRDARRGVFSMTMARSFRAAPALAALVFLALPAVAHGQPNPPAPPDPAQVDQLIADLDAREYKVRQAATRQLLDAGLPVRPALLRALQQKGISLEMRRRLRQVADEILGFRPLEASPVRAEDVRNHLADYDAMLLIDNAADWQRYRTWLPDLPRVDFRKKLMLVVVSWDSRPRTIEQPFEDGATLVVPVKAEPPTRETEDEHAPKILVAEVTAWAGPVRFELNGRPQFTAYKGKELVEQAAALWKEIKRLCDGGAPTLAQRLELARPQWDDGTHDAAIAAELARQPVAPAHETKAIVTAAFRRLGAMRATPAVAEMWAMARTLSEFDVATEGLGLALATIGGPEVTTGCAAALKAQNRFAQSLGVQVACSLGDPELRPVFHEALTRSYGPVVRGGLMGLERIGRTRADVPALVALLGRVDTLRDGNEDTVQLAAWYLGELGADAAAALPALEKLRGDTNPFLRDAAEQAVAKIKVAE